jgi:hypothetical protein
VRHKALIFRRHHFSAIRDETMTACIDVYTISFASPRSSRRVHAHARFQPRPTRTTQQIKRQCASEGNCCHGSNANLPNNHSIQARWRNS